MAEADGQPVAVDLFSGAGGLSEGLLAAGVNVALAVELHPHPALTHSFNHPGTTVLCGDVRDLDIRRLRGLLRQRCGTSTVDIVAGGPPCQGFSVAGKRNKRDPRNQLVYHFVRAIKAFKPKVFVFENVPGLGQLRNGGALHKVLDGFWELGYEIHGVDNQSDYYPTEYPIVDASCFGIPQRRKRLILVGWRKGLIDGIDWPAGADDCGRTGDGNVSVRDAICDLDFLSAGRECHSYQEAPQSSYQQDRRSHCDLLFNHLATKHQIETVNMFRRFRPGYTVSSIPERLRTGKQRVRRLCWTEPSPAVLALPDDYIHPRRHRIPTVREMARLQSFDDSYVFLGKRTTSDKNRRVDVPQYTQVGNAVPPLLAKRLGEAILRSLGYKCVDLRDLSGRQRRHSWVVGSSGFHGYELIPAAIEQMDIIVEHGDPCILPINEGGATLGNGSLGIMDWTGGQRRRTRRSRCA